MKAKFILVNFYTQKPMKKFGFVFFCFISSINFIFANHERETYRHIIALRLDEAKLLLAKNPHKSHDQILNQQYFNTIQFLAEGKISNYEALSEDLEKVADEIENNADPKNAADAYILAEIKLLDAFTALSVGEKFSAVMKMRQAYALLIENVANYPNFIPHYKSLGLLKALLGAVPTQYQWILGMIGLEGNVKLGLKYLDKVIISNQPNAIEAQIYKALLYAYLLSDNEKAIAEADVLRKENQNGLAIFAASLIYYKTEKHSEAMLVLKNISGQKVYYHLPYIQYLKADMLLSEGKFAEAELHFLQFLKDHKGDNFIKDSYYKLILCKYLNGSTQYASYLKAIEEKGTTNTEADKNALNFAENPSFVHRKLLLSRLKTDGGHYEAALSEIQSLPIAELKTLKEKTEWLYRKARILHKLKEDAQALAAYKACIESGKNLPHYFAANAALQIGYMMRDNFKKMTEAKIYFQLAMSYKKHEYKYSIDQKAKTALSQLNDMN